jgi:hypothetical protein
MQKISNPFERHLSEELAHHGFKLAGLLGRKLFESGHYHFAEASAVCGLSLEVAQGVARLEDLAAQFDARLWNGLRALQALIYSVELCIRLDRDFFGFLETTAKSDLNRIRTRPTFSEIGLSIQQFLSAEKKALKNTLLDCSVGLEKLHAEWQVNLESCLEKSKIGPVSLVQLLPLAFEPAVVEIVTDLKLHMEILNRWQSHFYNALLGTYQPFGFKSTREPFARAVRDFDALRVHTLLTTKQDFQRPHKESTEAVTFAFSNLEFLFIGFSLIQLAREDLLHFAEQPSQALLNENFYYAEALEKQLRSMGLDAKIAGQLNFKLFNYCEGHATRAMDLLDDELQKLCPMVSKEMITAARLKVRLEDVSFPLSVQFKENVERAFVR